MSDLNKKITDDLKTAMKSKDKLRVSVLRMIMAEIKVAEKSGKEFKHIDVVNNYAKKLRKSIDEYKKLGADENVTALESELTIAQEFLPEQMSTEELNKIIGNIITENNFTIKDMGKIMRSVMDKYGDVVDGRQVQEIVKNVLNS